MGWDAYSSVKKDYTGKTPKIVNPVHAKAFKNAFAYVKRKAGSVDGYLDGGALDCSACAFMLEKATGRTAWFIKGWDKKQVKKIAKKANWDFKYHKDKAWAYWSAKKFLETCAKQDLAIQFSW